MPGPTEPAADLGRRADLGSGAASARARRKQHDHGQSRLGHDRGAESGSGVGYSGNHHSGDAAGDRTGGDGRTEQGIGRE